ncbi:MAG: hypothetical protein NT118_04970 [Lentisphaerae bacterium]|nr:hypothetical protein [Lentisphaerota bacterium]
MKTNKKGVSAMKKFTLFVCAVSSVALFAATPEFNLAFDSANGTTPKDWVINPSHKEVDGKTAGAVKVEKGTAGNVLVFTTNKQSAALYTVAMTPAKAGQTFNASASVSGKGSFAILFYSYTEKDEVSVPQVEFLELTDTPTVQKFSIPIANSGDKVVVKVRAVIIINPETELKLSDLKVSVD